MKMMQVQFFSIQTLDRAILNYLPYAFDIATGDFLTLKQSMSQTKFKIKMKVGIIVLQVRMPGNQNAIFQRNHIFFIN